MSDNLDPEYLRELEASLQASRQALDDWTTELLGGAHETEEERKIRILNNKELAENNKKIAEEQKRREDNVAALKQFGSSLLDTSKQVKDALLSTEGGMSKYNKSISSAGDAALALGKQFGPLTTVLGGVVKLFTLAAEIVTEGNEKLIKSYNSLSEIGATASLTTDDLFKLAKTAGYGVSTLESFIKPVKSLGTGLIALGGATGDGVKKFAELAATTEEQRAAYRRLGLSQEDVTQLQADYISKTTNSGQRIANSTEKQRKAADEYIESMITLAAFTGTDIKKQQEARDRALANEALNQAIYEKELKRADLQDKLKGEEDQVKRKSIQAEIDKIGEQIKQKTLFGQFAATTLDAKNAQAAYEIAASDGSLVLTDSTKALVTAGMNPQKIADLLNKGKDGIEEFVDQLDKSARRNTKLFGAGLSQFGTTYSQNMQAITGMSNQTRLLSILRLRGEYKTLAEINQAIEDKKNGLGKDDPTLKVEHARLEAEKNTQSAMDALFRTLQDFVNPALLSFYEAITEMVDWIIAFIPRGEELGSEQDKKRREYKKAKAYLKILEPSAQLYPDNKSIQADLIKNRDIVANYQQKGIYSTQAVAIRNSSEGQRSTLGSGRASAIVSNASASAGAVSSTETGAVAPTQGSSKSPDNSIEEGNTGRGSTIKNDSGKPTASRGQGSERPKTTAAVFHHTGGPTLQDAISTLQAKGNAYNYIIDRDGTIVPYMPNNLVAYHAGTKAGSKVTNWNSIGIAAVANDDKDVNQKQIAAAINLNRQLSSFFGYSDIYGHGEISPGKQRTEGMSMVSAIKSGGVSASDIPKYGDGGIVDTPQLAWVGDKGREAIVPLSNPDSILSKLLTGSSSEVASMMNGTGSNGVSTKMIEAMIYKFDTIISYLSEGVDIQQKILRHSS